MTLWKKLKVFFLIILTLFRKKKCSQPKISILIPFSSRNPVRKLIFKWLIKYWQCELPHAEIIIGHNHDKVFCKGAALNDAIRRSTGKVIVIMDADAYMPGNVLNRCADRILEELDNHLWYVPYRHLYRLRRWITSDIIASDPCNPLRIPSPPPLDYITDKGHNNQYGHRYGAMVMIFPRQAFEVLGCFDERFRGWGGEDVALLRALDTLWGKHKTTDNDVLHLWHPFIGADYKTRRWAGQKHPNANNHLANKYNRATRRPLMMRELVDQGCKKIKNGK